jgi:hypothetical protein
LLYGYYSLSMVVLAWSMVRWCGYGYYSIFFVD